MIKVKFYWLVILLVAILLALKFVYGYSFKQGALENSKTYGILTESLKVTRDDLGNEIAKREVLEFKSVKDIKNIANISKEVETLKKEVRKYKGKIKNAIIIKNETREIRRVKTEIIKDSTIAYPIYKTSWKDRWSVGSITARTDSIVHSIKIKNEFILTLGKERNGFRKRKNIATIKNLNPNTSTEEVITFDVTPKYKKFAVGVGGGVGFTNFETTTPFLGVGVYYTIFRF